MTSTELAKALARAQLSGDVILPGEPDYDKGRAVWNASHDRRPGAILRAADSEDVCRALRCVAGTGLPLAVQGGGHSLAGFSTCDDGLLLDLSRLGAVTVDPATCIAVTGGGALLGALDAAGEPHGLVTPAGLISHTGVGGLTLGGGMGWLSRRYGLTIDSLAGATVISAAGDVIDTDADVEPDLFWALRGGGGNFGVVTNFRFRMHPLGQMAVGTWAWPARDAATVLTALGAIAPDVPHQITASFSASPGQISLTVFASGMEGAGASIGWAGGLAPGASGGPLPLTYRQLQSRSDEEEGWGSRVYSRGGFLARIDPDVAALVAEAVSAAPNDTSSVYMIQLGGAVADVPEDATAYSGRAAGFYWIVNPHWQHSTDDARCIAWGRRFAARFAALSMAGNYVNEQADSSDKIAERAYGPAKYRRLARIKARFDPDNLFRLNQNIRPAA